MTRTLGILLAVIFAVISLFHLYWAAGGAFGKSVAVPTVAAPGRGDVRVFKPSAGGTLLRAIGEFRLVGFFKRVGDTPFAVWDTWLFSPLCLTIAIIAFILAYTEA